MLPSVHQMLHDGSLSFQIFLVPVLWVDGLVRGSLFILALAPFLVLLAAGSISS